MDLAVIHKATIGTTRLDPGYTRRKEEALRRGYLWGSYHWGVAGNPAKQADFYIDTVKPQANELMALDLEDAQSATLMNVDEAIVFINRVKERTGRYPVLYTNHSSAKLISARYKDSVFVHTPLWYARFKAKVSDFPTGVWPSYTLWQFSSEIKPQLPVPGTKSDMDINVYNGTPEQLKAAWPLTKAATPAASAEGISPSELSIGGIVSGATESNVLARLGEPVDRVETGEGTEYRYPGMLVTIAWMEEQTPGGQRGVAALKGTGATACTPRGLCPGMPVSAVAQLYGPTEPVVRETGTFLEYQPDGPACWLQISTSQGLVRSLAIACQP